MKLDKNNATTSSSNDEELPLYFYEWLKQRRQELDLTQAQLAQLASCSVFAIRKIELGERRPSKQLAELLARALGIPTQDQTTFIRVARGELNLEQLGSTTPTRASSPDSYQGRETHPVPGNLPRALIPFVGREPELAALGQLLRDPQCSCLTIAGLGGIGKTRLAVEAANRSQELFPDGVWFVPLVALNSPALIVPAIAQALNFRFHDSTNPLAQLLHYLREKTALLVLDNAEHLLDGAGVLVEILNACPHVKLLVTSRERLNLLSEWLFEVRGLPVPANDQGEQFEAYSSVILFLQSARRVRSDFALQGEELHWILKICQLVEGMPLGIELAAAWVGLLSCEEIAKELQHNLEFLTVSLRDLPERQRSLRATLDHSWNLLHEEEKLILSRFAVFQGYFRREAAQEICGASLAVLSALRNKMLLYQTDQGFYHLHELIRQYAERKLKENPEECERVQDRHADYYVGRLAGWEKAIKSARQVEIFDEMAQVIDNLSPAWQRMITSFRPQTIQSQPFDPDRFHRALFSLSLFYEMRCRSLEAVALFQESVEHLQMMREAFENSGDRKSFYSVLGHLTAWLGLHHLHIQQDEKARGYLEEAIQWLEMGQSRGEKAQAQVMLAATKYKHGHFQESVTLLEQSRQVFREEGDDWWYLLATINLATSYYSLGNIAVSEALCQEGFQLIVPGDLRLELSLRINFALILLVKGDFARAEQWMHENLQLSFHYQNQHQTAYIYGYLGQIALATHQDPLAEGYFRKGIDLLREFGESNYLAMNLIYLGRSLVAQKELEAARDQYRQAIKIGQVIDMFYLVYWGLVNFARTYLEEGQTGKALEIALTLKPYPVELKRIQDDRDRLLAELQAVLSEEEVEAIRQEVEGKPSSNQAVADVLAYVLEGETA